MGGGLPKWIGLLLLWGLLFSSSVQGGEARLVVGHDRHHIVHSGENLFTIAQNYGLAIEHLAFANGRDPNNIQVAPGTELIIPLRRVLPANPPSDGLVINLPERGIFYFRHGEFRQFYPIAIGMAGRFQTPQGNFTITSLSKDPVWFPPEWAGRKEEMVPPGPDNPLGDRWIGISSPGIGIHSTTSPLSIGQAVSHGCMRMYPRAVHELFPLLELGWPVRIEYETAKLGSDPATGSYWIATFPDVYRQSAPAASLERLLDEEALSLSAEDLAYLASADGVARELLFNNIIVSVGKERLSQWPVDPTLIEGAIWVSPKVAQAAGLEVNWDAQERVVKVRYGAQALYFPLDPDYVLDPLQIPLGSSADVISTARQLGSHTLIPLRPLLEIFKIPNEWDDWEKELHLSKLKPWSAPQETAIPQTSQGE